MHLYKVQNFGYESEGTLSNSTVAIPDAIPEHLGAMHLYKVQNFGYEREGTLSNSTVPILDF